ncbi:hypothetical protein [Kitasatospora purpeofusca]|uniref:hypothetical protein n=1 Tax=Kitasatospora purpeofusca TaxID=67352 RepID=UPI00386F44B3|nr:hypothetical protein OIP63_12035 [Kitasatospora purpeofusca]
MAPPLLAAAVVLLAVKWARRRRSGRPVPLLPRSLQAWVVALAVIGLVTASGALVGQLWTSVIPAVALGGLAGAFVDLRYGSSR